MSLILVNLLKNQISEDEGRILCITNLAAIAALNSVENKIPNATYLIKKDYDEKIKYIESKYFSTSDYDKFIDNIYDTKIKKVKNQLTNLLFLDL